MTDIVVEYKNQLRATIRADRSTLQEIWDSLYYTFPNFQFTPAFKSGRWDGKIRLLNLRDCDQAKQPKLMGLIHSEVAEIVANGPKADDLQKVKLNLLKKYTEDQAENGWWSGALERYYHDKLNLLTDYKASVDALTPELIQSTLKNIVSQGNVIEVVMKPAE
jgi:hypothetical protein